MEKTYEDGGRDWSDASTKKKRNIKDCRPSPEARRKTWNRSTLRTSRSDQPCWHLDFRLLASKTVRKFMSFRATQFVVICYGNCRKLIQPVSDGTTSKTKHQSQCFEPHSLYISCIDEANATQTINVAGFNFIWKKQMNKHWFYFSLEKCYWKNAFGVRMTVNFGCSHFE